MKYGARSLPTAAPETKVASAPNTDTNATLPSTPVPDASSIAAAAEKESIPSVLKDDALIMKALGLYKSTAENAGSSARN